MKLKRDSNCDESYEHFVAESAIRMQDKDGQDLSTEAGVTFGRKFVDLRIPPLYRLECYVLREHGFHVLGE